MGNLFFIGLAFTVPAVLFSYPEGFGFVPLAGLAMAASSVSVTASSLALKRWTPPRLG
ncbi:MAG TPA: hypothetical protein VGQ13_08860 [Nitrososphaera sp.]|nr:hypothetical protein [Nitrososphaera sp.]